MSNEPIYHFHEEAATATISKLQAEAAAQHSANRIATAKAVGIGAIGVSIALGILAVSCALAYHIYLKKPIIVTEYVKQKQVITTTVEVPVTKIEKVNNDVVVTKIEKVNNDVVVTKIENTKTVVAEEVIKDGQSTGYYKAGIVQTKGNMYAKFHPKIGTWGIEGWIKTNVQHSDVPVVVTYRNGETYQGTDDFYSPDLLTYTYIDMPRCKRCSVAQENEPVSLAYFINDTKYVFPIIVTEKLKGPKKSNW